MIEKSKEDNNFMTYENMEFNVSVHKKSYMGTWRHAFVSGFSLTAFMLHLNKCDRIRVSCKGQNSYFLVLTGH